MLKRLRHPPSFAVRKRTGAGADNQSQGLQQQISGLNNSFRLQDYGILRIGPVASLLSVCWNAIGLDVQVELFLYASWGCKMAINLHVLDLLQHRTAEWRRHP